MLTRVRTDFVNRMCETFSQNPVVVNQFPELQNCAVAIESARGILHNYCQDDWIEPHFENLDGQAVAILHLGQDADPARSLLYTSHIVMYVVAMKNLRAFRKIRFWK